MRLCGNAHDRPLLSALRAPEAASWLGEMFEGKQPPFCLRTRNDFSRGQDVANVDPHPCQGAAEKQASMAVERVGLRAHGRDPVLLRDLHQPRQAGAEGAAAILS